MARNVQYRREVSEACNWHQDEAMNSTIYILYQTGPTGFLLKEEGEEAKNFKVQTNKTFFCHSLNSVLILHKSNRRFFSAMFTIALVRCSKRRKTCASTFAGFSSKSSAYLGLIHVSRFSLNIFNRR